MRCYNGCPDGDLKAWLLEMAKARETLKKANPKARCVYYPMGEFYQVFLENKMIGNEHKDMFDAINEAVGILALGKPVA